MIRMEDITREQELNLVAMIYKLEGTTQLEKLVKQTEDDKTHNVLLQTESNFLNYMNFGNLRSQDRATQDEHKIPLKIAKVQTDCKYQAPTLAVGTDIGGPNVRGEELAFVLSNPPFIHCGPESDRAKYSINFGISNGDYTKFTKTKFSDPQNVRFEITQIVGGNNLVKLDEPKYFGKLTTDAGQNDEKSFDLVIERGTSIFSECIVHEFSRARGEFPAT